MTIRIQNYLPTNYCPQTQGSEPCFLHFLCLAFHLFQVPYDQYTKSTSTALNRNRKLIHNVWRSWGTFVYVRIEIHFLPTTGGTIGTVFVLHSLVVLVVSFHARNVRSNFFGGLGCVNYVQKLFCHQNNIEVYDKNTENLKTYYWTNFKMPDRSDLAQHSMLSSV